MKHSGILLVIAACLLPAAEYPVSRHGGPYMLNYYIPPAPGGTPWAPCWSPDGQWIAVAMAGSIWKVDPQTGAATELTQSTGYASSPAWSPDGNWIVYATDHKSTTIQLEAVNLTTGESHALTDDQHLYLDPVFSPDGKQLAYVSTQPRGYFNIYIRAIRDGHWDGEPIAVTMDNRYPRDRLYFGYWDMHTQPAWTPDGKNLVLVSNRGVPLGSGDVWIVPAKAGGMAEATSILKEQTLYRTRPHVSPEGKRLLYTSTVGPADQFNNLYVIPIEGGSPYKLTFGAYDHFHPRWSPDGEHIAYISNEDGVPQLAILEAWGGEHRKIRITERHWRRPVGRLTVRIVDAATGKLTGARIQGLAADGRFYTPPDTYARIAALGRDYFHTTGEFTMDVPPGRMVVEAVKGFEYLPARQEIQVERDKTVTATLVMRRLVDMPAKGWINGSTHVHMNYGGNLHNTPDNLAMMAAAEDLHIVNAMVANKDNRVLDYQYFLKDRKEYPLKKPVPGVHILFGEEYRPAFYGHTFLLGLRDHFISPVTSNYEGTALDSLYPTNTDIFRKARAQGAVTAYVHPMGDSDPLKSRLGSVSKGVAVDAALGTTDALEWSGAVRAQMAVWHRLLNNDIVLAPVGGEDSINDLHRLRTLGAIRTYVHLDGPVSADAWLEGVRKGHTFFTTGPLIEFRVNGKLPGDVLQLPAGGGTVTLEGSVRSVGPLSKVTVFHRGGVFREIPLNADGKGAQFKEQVRITDSDWFALAVEGPQFDYFDATYLLAGSSAVRVYAGDRKIRDRQSAEYFMKWIDILTDQTKEWPWWRSEAEKAHVFSQYQEARRVYERLAAEAQN
jgi:TolB protein